MKKLTGALVLSLSLLLSSACRSAETQASAPEAAAAVRKIVPKDDAGPPPSAGQPSAGVELDGMKQDSGTGTASATLSEEERKAQESCLDKWLQSRKLDRYGSPEGTMYAGGTPLFDERTGESRDRLDFVYERQPEAKKACATAPAPKEAPPKKK